MQPQKFSILATVPQLIIFKYLKDSTPILFPTSLTFPPILCAILETKVLWAQYSDGICFQPRRRYLDNFCDLKDKVPPNSFCNLPDKSIVGTVFRWILFATSETSFPQSFLQPHATICRSADNAHTLLPHSQQEKHILLKPNQSNQNKPAFPM